MKKIKFIALLLFSTAMLGQTQIGADIDGEAAYDQSGERVCLSADGSIIAIGADSNSGNGDSAGSVRVYKNLSGIWTQIGNDIDGEAEGELSGWGLSLSADGSIIAIGARGLAFAPPGLNFIGKVRVYKNVLGVWTKIGNSINGTAVGAQFGSTVRLSSDGTVVAIGSESSNKVRVYKNVDGIWTKIGLDIGASVSRFGQGIGLSADGSILAIGSSSNSDVNGAQAGKVEVYENVLGVWTKVGTDINGETSLDNSGWSVSLSSDGSIIAIGAIGVNKNKGQVRVFKNISGTWTQIGANINGVIDFQTGWSVNLSADGNILAIGSRAGDGEFARARVYQNVSGAWVKIGSDFVYKGQTYVNTALGLSLSSDGRILAIGNSPGNGKNGVFSGVVKVYDIASLLSTDEFSLKNFTIYPNPANNAVTISLQDNCQLEKVNIYNDLGQLVKTEKTAEFSVQDLSNGKYYFEVFTDKGKGTKKILID